MPTRPYLKFSNLIPKTHLFFYLALNDNQYEFIQLEFK